MTGQASTFLMLLGFMWFIRGDISKLAGKSGRFETFSGILAWTAAFLFLYLEKTS